MVEDGGGGAAFPAVFFDGERDVHIGNVVVHPAVDFKSFQLSVCQKIGISPNQISIYLVDCKKPKWTLEDSRRIPITGRVNFSLIAREKDCYFLVVLKRSRKERRRKPKEYSEYLAEDHMPPPPVPEKFLLLRRNHPESNNPQVSGYVSPFYNRVMSSELANLNDRLQNLQIQRDNYTKVMMKNPAPNLNWNSNLISNSEVSLDLNSFPRIEDSYATSTLTRKDPLLCEECMNAKKGKTVPFHCCVYDPVIVGFETTAGPIARPSKASF